MSNDKEQVESQKNRDSSDRRNENQEKSLQKSLSEVQDSRKQGIKTEDQSINNSQKTVKNEIDRDNPLQIVDNSEKKQIKGLELDADGNVSKYTDKLGETYKKDEKGQWMRFGLLSPQGEPVESVKLDEKGNLNITFKFQKDDSGSESVSITKQILPDGSEKTIYPKSMTLTTREDNDKTKVVTVYRPENGETPCGTLQTVKFSVLDPNKPPMCSEFTAPDGTVYKANGQVDDKGHYLFDKYSQGEKDEKFKGYVSADTDGCAVVFNQNEGANPKTIRYLPDGTVAFGSDSKNRTVMLVDGRTIERTETSGLATMTTRLPADGSTTKVEFDRQGLANKITYTTKDGQTSTYSRFDGDADFTAYVRYGGTSGWYDEKGNIVDMKEQKFLDFQIEGGSKIRLDEEGLADKFTSKGRNPIEERPLIQEVPENYKELLEKRFDRCRNDASLTTPIQGSWTFKNLTQDDGDWDDKRYGVQYEQWGNAAWGMYANELGYEFEDANLGVGVYKIFSGKSRLNWISTSGQDPRDYRVSKDGFELRERQRNQSEDQVLKSKDADVELPTIPSAPKDNNNVAIRNVRRDAAQSYSISKAS
ncbi:MAG: hypothetical protein K2Y39_20390 [Candidatus Obscuribacterales bacterium]|nr:hypothetical protein [Candidatus Obscuribacterales bacterium]